MASSGVDSLPAYFKQESYLVWIWKLHLDLTPGFQFCVWGNFFQIPLEVADAQNGDLVSIYLWICYKTEERGNKGRNGWSQGPEEEFLFAFLLDDDYYSVFWIQVFSFLEFYPGGWNCERLSCRLNCLLSCGHYFSRVPCLKPPGTLMGYELPFKCLLEELDSKSSSSLSSLFPPHIP